MGWVAWKLNTLVVVLLWPTMALLLVLLHMPHFHLVIEAGTTHHLHLILCLVEIEGGVEVEVEGGVEVEEGVRELCLQWILCLVEVGGKVLVGVEVPVAVYNKRENYCSDRMANQ